VDLTLTLLAVFLTLWFILPRVRTFAGKLNLWLQAHHLETEYYDRFMQPRAYHDAFADYGQTWHAEQSTPHTHT